MAEEEGLTVDEAGFKAAMENQKKMARENANFSQKAADASVFDVLPADKTSTFTGYDHLATESSIIAIADENGLAESVSEGETATIITKETTFYATMGGQKGDTGVISTATAEFTVSDTVKIPNGRIGHIGTVTKGSLKTGDIVKLSVNEAERKATSKNHSATHLLQGALQQVFGDSVHQKGSSQDTERTRFDFSYSSAMTADEIAKVEKIVNEQINAALPIRTDVMTIEEAKKTGAMALFGEKYGDTVRVVSMGDFSKELCGGTHVANTADIQAFKILSESSVSAGVRRIEAITGDAVLDYYKNEEKELFAAAEKAKCAPLDVSAKIAALLDEIKALKSENEKLKNKLASNAAGDAISQATDINGVKTLALLIADADPNALKTLGDDFKTKLGSAFILLVSNAGGKVSLVAMATDDAVARGAHAGNLIKEVAPILGGGGGGRPNMAQAGGKDAAKITEALAKAKEVMASQIK